MGIQINLVWLCVLCYHGILLTHNLSLNPSSLRNMDTNEIQIWEAVHWAGKVAREQATKYMSDSTMSAIF